MKKLVVGVIAATLALAACGGSSKKSVNPVAGGTTAPTTTGGSSSGGNSDLSKLAGNFAKAKIKITYASTTSGNNETITIAQDGNGKSAFSTGDSTIYNDGTKSVACQGTGTSAHCTDMGSLGASSTANIGALFTSTFSGLAAAMSSLGGGDKSSETIAGRDASCVKYKASDLVGKLATLPLFKDSTNKASDYDPNDSATICVDKQTGYLLKLSSTKKGKDEESLSATAVSEPTDSDFTPPVTPATIPSLPGNITIPSIPSP